MASKKRTKKNNKKFSSTVQLELGFDFNNKLDSGLLLDGNSVLSQRDELKMASNGETILRYLNNGITKEFSRRASQEEIKTWLKKNRWHFMHFNLMCVQRLSTHKRYLPVEFSLNAFTFESGLQREFHCFLDPGRIPSGHALDAKVREESHRIPAFEGEELRKLSQFTIEEIAKEIQVQVANGSKFVAFTYADKISEVYGSYEWLSARAAEVGITLPEVSVFSIVDLVYLLGSHFKLRELKQKIKMETEFTSTNYDFESGINCGFHEQFVSAICSLSSTRKMSCVFSQLLAECFGTKLLLNEADRLDLVDNAVVKAFRFTNDKIATDLRKRNPKPVPPPGFFGDIEPIQEVPPGFENAALQELLQKLSFTFN